MSYETGMKPNWGALLASDNPVDMYLLDQDEAKKIGLFFGFGGRNQGGEANSSNQTREIVGMVCYETTRPTLTNFSDLPIGSFIICPKLTTPKIIVKCKASSTPAVGDWYSASLTAET